MIKAFSFAMLCFMSNLVHGFFMRGSVENTYWGTKVACVFFFHPGSPDGWLLRSSSSTRIRLELDSGLGGEGSEHGLGW
jgi:hypothetical protein